MSAFFKRLAALAIQHPDAVRLIVERNQKLLDDAFKRRASDRVLPVPGELATESPHSAPWNEFVNELQVLSLVDEPRARARIATTIIMLTGMLARHTGDRLP